jgi:hypothetical protein
VLCRARSRAVRARRRCAPRGRGARPNGQGKAYVGHGWVWWMPRRGLSSSKDSCRDPQAARDGYFADLLQRGLPMSACRPRGADHFTVRGRPTEPITPLGDSFGDRARSEHEAARRPTWFAADGPPRVGSRASAESRLTFRTLALGCHASADPAQPSATPASSSSFGAVHGSRRTPVSTRCWASA